MDFGSNVFFSLFCSEWLQEKKRFSIRDYHELRSGALGSKRGGRECEEEGQDSHISRNSIQKYEFEKIALFFFFFFFFFSFFFFFFHQEFYKSRTADAKRIAMMSPADL
jgi:hypothetical protein